MNIFRLTTTILSLTLLVACGGGGSNTTTRTPTVMTPPTTGGQPTMPTGPQDLPNALVTNVEAARGFVNALGENARTQSTPPTITMPTEIQAAFQMEAMDADTLVNSDAFVRNMSFSNGANISAGGNIALDDFTFRSSLENIRMEIADRFNLEGVSSQYTPVMDHRGVMLAQYQAAGRTDDNDVLEYQSYGGWLTNSAFSVDVLTIDHGSREDSILIGISYGDATGSRPTATVSYAGAIVGIHKNDGGIYHGLLSIDVSTFSNTASISFTGIVNINDGNELDEMLWGIPIATDGTFTSTTGGDIDGAFYGTGHTEVGGTFNRNGIIGAFGGTRQ